MLGRLARASRARERAHSGSRARTHFRRRSRGLRTRDSRAERQSRRGRWIAAAGIAAATAVVAVLMWATPRMQITPASAPANPLATVSARPRLQAGIHYEQLNTAAPTQAGTKVEVAEFFMYGCYHCYTFEQQLEEWHAALPAFATLVRVPAIFNPLAEFHARAFYTASALGKIEEMHPAFYEEIHRSGNRLDSADTLRGILRALRRRPWGVCASIRLYRGERERGARRRAESRISNRYYAVASRRPPLSHDPGDGRFHNRHAHRRGQPPRAGAAGVRAALQLAFRAAAAAVILSRAARV